MNDSLAKKVKKFFIEKFQREPQVFFSPGRINLIGEHVDYNNGFVMPAAVDKGIYFAVAPNDENTARFFAADLNEEYAVPLDAIAKSNGWKNYVLGIVDQLQRNKYPIRGFDCVLSGDLPAGAGMSSSAAVECGLGYALNIIFNLHIDRILLAKLGQKAEHSFPGVNCGIMDQFANMMGKKDHVILLDCRNMEYKYLQFSLKNFSLVLINSKVHHSHASSAYNMRRRQCEEGFKILRSQFPLAQSLRDISEEDLMNHSDLMEQELFEKCLFVVQEINRTRKAAIMLEQNDLPAFGKLMFETHEGLSGLYHVSCEELDFLVDQAKQNESVLGARVMGGGFGGCTINLVHQEAVTEFVETATKAYQEKYNIVPEAYLVKLENGTAQLSA